MRPEILLMKIHGGTLRLKKCRARAKSVWWLGISEEIAETIEDVQFAFSLNY
jgi:hypothetical protein